MLEALKAPLNIFESRVEFMAFRKVKSIVFPVPFCEHSRYEIAEAYFENCSQSYTWARFLWAVQLVSIRV